MARKSKYAKDAKLREALSGASKAERQEYLRDRDPDDIAPPHDKQADKQTGETETDESEETETDES